MVFKINGLKYHVFEFPMEKEFIFLIPEPENPFDPNAVAVYNKYHQRIGYCPIKNTYNEKMLKLIESGQPFVCQVILSNQAHQFLLVDVLIPEKLKKGKTTIGVLKKFRMN